MTLTTLPRLAQWQNELEKNREVKATAIKEVLLAARGNITHAAALLPLSRARLTILLRELGLQDFARDLRRAAGARGNALGRPIS
jgi:DNA-binding NtrC family response regulator